jgi:hypothetical protein
LPDPALETGPYSAHNGAFRMLLVPNVGADRVLDRLRRELHPGATLDAATSQFSLFAFEALITELAALAQCRLALAPGAEQTLGGSVADRPFRNQLRQPWLARQCAAWLRHNAQVRSTAKPIAQALFLAGDTALSGDCPFTTAGLAITPGDHHGMVHATADPGETAALAQWFASLWEASPAQSPILQAIDAVAAPQPPSLLYHLVLHHLLGAETAPDPDRLADPSTGIRDTVVWRKLYRFQRDGVLGALDKLDRLGGCIIADSVGLGKTFEALAIIKRFELRNQRALVLCPKRLRDNWTLYKSNDQRNFLAPDRFSYDVLNHTDLSRSSGMSGDINLAHLNWGNYDLVVIDESHNFRNKPSGAQTRYARLMNQIIRAGVKTRVLMLSATPVNNRLADLKNQLSFVTEGNDHALRDHGIPSLDRTIRQAQLQFKRWLDLDEPARTSARLLEMLGFDYFTLLDLTTIARSRKHIERYYGTQETGRFPDRLPPVNFKPDVDRAGEFRPIKEINNEIRRLHLAVYAPMKYLLPHKKAEYDAKYSTKIPGGQTLFSQVDRETSLVHLLRVNTLKRMESAVSSFALTVGRQLDDVEAALKKIEAGEDAVDETNISDIDVDDARFEPLLAGTKVRVLLRDIDLARWGQELREDRDRLSALVAAARQVNAARDAKLQQLRQVILEKVRQPLNPGNRKVLVFTAFAETADYLYRELAPWARQELGLHSALVTGGDTGNQTTLPGLRRDLASILTAFSPRSKERPAALANEPEIDLMFATDCISEGQNLQDCDYLVNYDIHWNPVRIIQRFGRIDRIGSLNRPIQLVNFWPNLQLDEYINLERRVSGKMKLLDISATGEENIIEEQSADEMNDLEYRRKQLLRLQDAVIDLEDLGGGISITDLTFADFRLDLAAYRQAHPGRLEATPLGLQAAVLAAPDTGLAPGTLFLLRAEGDRAAKLKSEDDDYPLAPHYLVHVSPEGAILLPHTQTKSLLDGLKRACFGIDAPDPAAQANFDRATRHGEDMNALCRQLAAAIASVAGRGEARALASLFSPGGTHALPNAVAGDSDFEVLALLAVVRQ